MNSSNSIIFVQSGIAILKLILTVLDTVIQWVTESVLSLHNITHNTNKNTIIATNHNEHRNQKTVVIVGGNFAGMAALWELLAHNNHDHHQQSSSSVLRIILIDPKEYFEYTPGVLRLFCEPQHFTNIAKRHPTKYMKHPIEKIQGKVLSLTNPQGHKVLTYEYYCGGDNRNHNQLPKQFTTASLAYDYVILATGSTYHYPISPSLTAELSLQQRQLGWKKAYLQLQKAHNILILGGGAVGVELAAEIVDYYPPPQKQVTLVDACSTLVPLFPNQVGTYATQWLQHHGVSLVLGKLLKSWNATSCTLQDGTVLQADIVYVCFGDRPNSQCTTTTTTNNNNSNHITSNTPWMNRKGNILVSSTLQLMETEDKDTANQDIFVCGDVAAPPTEGNKQAFHAEMQGHLAAQNVLHKHNQQRLLKYPQDLAHASQLPLIFILSLGRYDGVLGFNQLVLTGSITAILKWGLEYTKVLHMQGSVLGQLIWKLADAVVLFLSRTILLPKPPTTTTLTETTAKGQSSSTTGNAVRKTKTG
jgi:NADH dehydrogenase FAD-containing subunit